MLSPRRPGRAGRAPSGTADVQTFLAAVQSGSHAQFDNITRLVVTVLQAPMALIVLLDEPGMWLVGESPGATLAAQLRPLQPSLAQAALNIAGKQLVVVDDATQHDLLRDAAWVKGSPDIHFFAGAPLLGSSSTGTPRLLGVLCVLDNRARSLDASLAATLTSFASLAAQEVERSQVAEAAATAAVASAAAAAAARDDALLQAAMLQASCCDDGVLVVDVRQPEWPIMYANRSWASDTGVAVPPDASPSFWDLLRPWTGTGCMRSSSEGESVAGSSGSDGSGGAAAVRQTAHGAVAAGVPVCLRVVGPRARRPLRVSLRPSAPSSSPAGRPHSAIPEHPSNGAGLSPAPSGRFQQQPGPGPFWVVVCAGPRRIKAVGPGFGAALPTGLPLGDARRPLALARSASSSDVPPDNGSINSNSTCSALSRMASASLASSTISRVASGTLGRSLSRKPSGGISLPASKFEQLQTHGHVTPEAFTEVELGPVLGKGSFGRVHRAFWKGAEVAVKAMETTDDVVCSAGGAQGALFEAVLARDLSHPNIVQTYDYALRSETVLQEDSEESTIWHVWIVQQFANRGTLRDCNQNGWLKQGRRSGTEANAVAVLQTAQEIASAMTYLHSHGIIHGDLSSCNVLLHSSTRDHRGFTALVSDFGLACLAVTAKGGLKYDYGTVSFMPPEMLEGGLLSEAVDVYSFGVLLWEMWMGSRAWAGCTQAQVLHIVSSGRAQLQLPEDATPGYKALCERCLNYDHTQRPSFEEILHEVMDLLAEEAAAVAAGPRAKHGGFNGPPPAAPDPPLVPRLSVESRAASLSLSSGAASSRTTGAALRRSVDAARRSAEVSSTAMQSPFGQLAAVPVPVAEGEEMASPFKQAAVVTEDAMPSPFRQFAAVAAPDQPSASPFQQFATMAVTEQAAVSPFQQFAAVAVTEQAAVSPFMQLAAAPFDTERLQGTAAQRLQTPFQQMAACEPF